MLQIHSCRGKANHFLGLVDFLKSAQINKELEHLWTGSSSFTLLEPIDNERDEEYSPNTLYSVQKAKSLFYETTILLGPSTSELARMNLRYLALTTGPEESSREVIGLTAGELVHTSIGIRARLAAAAAAAKKECSKMNGRHQTLMSSFDVPFASSKRSKRLMDLYETCKETIPNNWNFLQLHFVQQVNY